MRGDDRARGIDEGRDDGGIGSGGARWTSTSMWMCAACGGRMRNW